MQLIATLIDPSITSRHSQTTFSSEQTHPYLNEYAIAIIQLHSRRHKTHSWMPPIPLRLGTHMQIARFCTSRLHLRIVMTRHFPRTHPAPARKPFAFLSFHRLFNRRVLYNGNSVSILGHRCHLASSLWNTWTPVQWHLWNFHHHPAPRARVALFLVNAGLLPTQGSMRAFQTFDNAKYDIQRLFRDDLQTHSSNIRFNDALYEFFAYMQLHYV